jgi:diguanylate cyclase (GGDEF)-like protein
MSNAGERLIVLGGRLLLEQSVSLIALLDEGGGLIEANPSLLRILALRPDVNSILPLLEPSSRARFDEQLLKARADQQAGPIMLNFADSPTAIPQSYRCYLAAVGEAQLVMLAEPVAPLDHRAAEEYMRVTSELATTARNMQKLSHELAKKQQVLETALAKIEQIARVDELTQLLNRRGIMLALADEVERVHRYRQVAAILLIDIDHFKQVNDRYGHPVGDHVLHDCAALLRRSIRATDHLGRYGGEEFLCVLPMTAEVAAADLAERLRRDVERARFTAAQTVDFSVTISIGVAELSPACETAELLIAHADSALYSAKTTGRNRVQVWRP